MFEVRTGYGTVGMDDPDKDTGVRDHPSPGPDEILRVPGPGRVIWGSDLLSTLGSKVRPGTPGSLVRSGVSGSEVGLWVCGFEVQSGSYWS